jgi:hypothetical protein
MNCERHDDLANDIREIRKEVGSVKEDVAYIRGKLDSQTADPPAVRVWLSPALQRWAAVIATLLSLLGIGLGASAHSERYPTQIESGAPGE